MSETERGRVIQRFPFAAGYLALTWNGPLLDERVMEEFAFFADRYNSPPSNPPVQEQTGEQG